MQEARRTLAVEKERLAKEATDHHSSATAETKRLVEEAEERATAAEERAREAIAQATTARAAGPEGGRVAADPRPPRGGADRGVGAHPGRLDHPAGNAEKERQLATLKSEVDRMSKRRDAITAQLASLRDVVAGFGEDES